MDALHLATRPYEVSVAAPGPGPGSWVGASSAVALADGGFVVAYRVRTTESRGGRVVLARSPDGVTMVPFAQLTKGQLGAESLERPALVRTDEGRWRLYLSCATPGTKHWRIALVEAAIPEELAGAGPITVFTGDDRTGVKDPVVRHAADGWEAWVCCHPLDVPGDEDRMVSRLAVSRDGVRWQWTTTTLTGRPGLWDARGARVTAVVGDHIYYDGRASADENFSERTGVAHRHDDDVTPVGEEPMADLRYLDVVPLPEGGHRIWYEAPLIDGSHELRTEVISPTV